MFMFKSCSLDELIRTLKDARDEHGGETIVCFASNYGDHSRTQQVHSLNGDIDEYPIKESGYSDSRYAIDESDDPEGGQTVLVIS